MHLKSRVRQSLSIGEDMPTRLRSQSFKIAGSVLGVALVLIERHEGESYGPCGLSRSLKLKETLACGNFEVDAGVVAQ